MNTPSPARKGSRSRSVKDELSAKKTLTQEKIKELSYSLQAMTRQLESLKNEIAKTEEEAELRHLEIEKTKIETKKIRWELFNLRAKWIFWPLTMLGAGLKLLSPSDAHAVSVSPPAIQQRVGHSGTTDVVQFSSMAKSSKGLNEPGWLSGRFHEKFRPLVDAVEKLYRSLGKQREEVAQALETLDSTLSVMNSEKDVLDMATAFAMDALRLEEKGVRSGESPQQMPKLGGLIPQSSFTYSSLAAQPLAALRQAAEREIAGSNITPLKDELAIISDRFLKSLPSQASSLASILKFDVTDNRPLLRVSTDYGKSDFNIGR